MKTKTLFAEDLRALMIERGINQKELAMATGLTEAAISYYLSGKRLPNIKSINAINKALGVTLNMIDYNCKTLENLERRVPKYYSDGVRYQKLMNDRKFDVLERIIEIEKEIISLEEEKRKLLEST